MFESLTERLSQAFRKLRAPGRLTPADVQAGLREIRQALLAADVHYGVVREILARVEERAVGERVVESLVPAEQLLGIVRSEIARAMGGEAAKLRLSGRPAIVLLVGPAGSGKTTTAGKVARHLLRKGRKPVLVCADPQRPAAEEQLSALACRLEIPFVSAVGAPREDVERAAEMARRELRDVLVVDTPGPPPGVAPPPFVGEIAAAGGASDVLLVLDALVGQEAVRLGEAFVPVGFTGLVLTKLDGDARGGAALSLPTRLARPVVFVGVGERLDDLEPFDPERMADRILGFGDLAGLAEKLEEAGGERVAAVAARVREGSFTLEDFLTQIEAMSRAGPLDQLLSRIPGLGKFAQEGKIEDEFRRTRAIIQSMTVEERRAPHIIGASRKRRIARGSGTTVQEVNQLLSQYEQARRLVRGFGKRRMPPGWGGGPQATR
ncbi:signal recognition particle protein [Candidatus Bipolaricaulota bacterium]|nr:signal recognition particle protein [Candidatus Bipolaricaulota bacterium]